MPNCAYTGRTRAGQTVSGERFGEFLLRLRVIDAPTITLVTDDQARSQLRNPI